MLFITTKVLIIKLYKCASVRLICKLYIMLLLILPSISIREIYDLGSQWNKAVVQVARLRTPFKITINGYKNSYYTGEMAIDDIKFEGIRPCLFLK